MNSKNSLKKRKNFKRNYLACLNCRTRKVKCDLGNVENPNDPPCARCKRERKECVFVESKRGLNNKYSNSLTTSDNNNSDSKFSSISLNDSNNLLFNNNKPISTVYSNSNNNNNNISSSNDKNDLSSDSNSIQNDRNNSSIYNSDNNLPSVNSSIQSLTNNATMIYLSHVAGKVALPDNRDRINGAERFSELERSVPIPRSLSSNTFNDSKSPQLNNDTEPINDSFGHGNFLYPIINQDRLTIPPLTTSQSMRQKPSNALANIEYILPKNSDNNLKNINHTYILTEIEAERLIKLFFITMHPFYPYIPIELRDPNILANYPMLLCALLAISARYNPLPNQMGKYDNLSDDDTDSRIKQRGEKNINLINYNTSERHLAVHEQLWIYCQRLMSMTVWGESSSRSVGTLLAFLLFTEWNPRAIHFRWGDYANNSQDDSLASKKFAKNKNVGGDKNNLNKRQNSLKNNSNNNSSSSSINNSDINDNNNNNKNKNKYKNKYKYNNNNANSSDDYNEEFAGLSAMKRSEIMSFMLIGTATRLSFLLDIDPLIFIATHISEIHIAIGLNKKSMLQQTLSEVDINDPSLSFSSYQKANIELLQFFSLCYETLYGTRPKFISLDKYQTLAILDILSPILENWYKKYYKLLKPSNIHCAPLSACNDDSLPDWLYIISKNPKIERDLTTSIERESLILDYYYTKLYLYSLALSGDISVNNNIRNSKKGRNLRLDELARYSRYVELAYKAAKEVLAVIQRVRRLKLLKYMPVRWVTRVIKSVSFIVKCYLTLTTDLHTNSNYENENENSKSTSPNNLNENKNSINNNDYDNNININNFTNNHQNTDGEILKLSVIPIEEIITLLQKTAICLRYAAPDELHLCTRYSTILMYLCSQFKTQIRERNEKKKMSIREYEKDSEFNSDNDNISDKSNNEIPIENNVYPVDNNIPQTPILSNIKNQQPQQQQSQQHIDSTNFENNPIFQNNFFNNQDNQESQQHDYNLSPNFNDLNNINFSNANQEFFDDFFNKSPSKKLFNFFSTNDNNPGLDFVDQFTKEIEKDFLSKGGKH